MIGWWLWPSADEPPVEQSLDSVSETDNATRLVSAIRPVSDASAQESAQSGVLFKSLDPNLRSSVNRRFSEAFTALNNDDFIVAEELLKELIKDYPQLSESYVNLAALYSKTNQLEKAQATLVNGFNANPTTAALYGSLQQVLGAQAAEAYQKAFDNSSLAAVSLDLPLLNEIVLQPAAPQTDSGQDNSELEIVNQQLVSLRKEMSTSKLQYESRIALLQKELANQAILVNNGLSNDNLASNVIEPQITKADLAPEPTVDVVAQVDVDAPSEEISVQETSQQALEQKRQKNAIDAVQRWAEAWSNQDVTGYVANYVDGYVPIGSELSHNEWVSERRDRLGNKKFIKVKVSRFKVEDLGGRFSVRFSQNYRSNTINDTITKKLTYVKGDDDWSNAKIVNEIVVSG